MKRSQPLVKRAGPAIRMREMHDLTGDANHKAKVNTTSDVTMNNPRWVAMPIMLILMLWFGESSVVETW